MNKFLILFLIATLSFSSLYAVSDEAKQDSKKAWIKVKEDSKSIWGSTKKTSKSAWSAIKQDSKNAWSSAKKSIHKATEE